MIAASFANWQTIERQQHVTTWRVRAVARSFEGR